MQSEANLRTYMRAAIKRKLRELGPYVDEELTDYIMVLVANKKNVHQMAEDLSLFLGRNSVNFTIWLHGVLEKTCSVAVEPGWLRPHYLQADSRDSTGYSQELGQAIRGGEEPPAPTLSSLRSNSPDAQLSISPTLGRHRNGFTARSLQNVLRAAQPPVGPLYSGARPRVESAPGAAPAAALVSWPRLKAGVAAPCASGWPSQGSGCQGSPSRLLNAVRGCVASEAPWGVDLKRRGFRSLRDGCPVGDEVTGAREDWGDREEVMSWRREQRTPSSIEHLRRNTDSEVRGANDAHDVIPRKPPVGGSVRRKLATTVREEVLVSTPRMVQDSWDGRESPSLSPRFIVTLEGAPSPLRSLKDDGEGDESELHSSEENRSVAVKRRKVPGRCRFWPACESGDNCSYHHPTTPCKTFPHCSYGDKCLFIHPNCKYNGQCSRVDCPYTHNSKGSLTSLSKLEAKMPPDLCHFFPECKKMDCQFYHPKPCRFAARCKRADCYFYHPPMATGDS